MRLLLQSEVAMSSRKRVKGIFVRLVNGKDVSMIKNRRKPSPVASNMVAPKKTDRRFSSLWMRLCLMIVLVTLLGTTLWIWPSLTSWVNRPIARVEVHSGFEFLEHGAVEEELEPFLVNRFFHLDLESMRLILLRMPWVREASIRRRWPDRLEVILQERQAVARWKKNKLITGEGAVFTPESVDDFLQLPHLSGPDEEALEVMQQYLAISQLLRPMGLSVKELRLGSSDSWRFTVDHVNVYVGRDRRMERLQRFVRLYHARLDSLWNEVDRVDLRYLNGAAVAWQNN